MRPLYADFRKAAMGKVVFRRSLQSSGKKSSGREKQTAILGRLLLFRKTED